VSDDLLTPDEAYDTAVSILEEWGETAQYALTDAAPGAERTLAAATSGLVMAMLKNIVLHRPLYTEDGWVCPSCVEMHGLGVCRAQAPCSFTASVFDAVLGFDRVERPTPEGLVAMMQDGPEPYVGQGAAELERMYGMDPAAARTHASSVVHAIARPLRKTRERRHRQPDR
jgi:hypothetical protein